MSVLVQDISKAFDSVARRAGKELSLRHVACDGRRRVERAPRAGLGPGRELLHVRVVPCCDSVCRCRLDGVADGGLRVGLLHTASQVKRPGWGNVGGTSLFYDRLIEFG